MIFPDKKIVYIKIPKTGSTSVYRYFADLDTYSTIINLNHLHGIRRDPRCFRRGKGWALGGHVSAQDIRWHLKDEYARYFKFTVVRNPYERLVSNYFWQRAKSRAPVSFKGFVKALIEDPSVLPKQCQLHAIPQMHWITDEAGELIVDQIIRLENIDQELRSTMRRLGLPEPVLGRSNETSHAHYSNYYDDALRSGVQKLYQADIDFLGYQFEDHRDPSFVDSPKEDTGSIERGWWSRANRGMKKRVRDWLRE